MSNAEVSQCVPVAGFIAAEMFVRILQLTLLGQSCKQECELCMIANKWFDDVDGGKELVDVDDVDVQISDKDKIIKYLWRLVKTKDN
ncbi:unnamed protein product [Fusarium fujikuroi]|nr:uncharacterized protein FFFS_15853 [Fusarium fujikuroi]VTT61427.1 unnamed protein product [Fusarium fujikuroi]